MQTESETNRSIISGLRHHHGGTELETLVTLEEEAHDEAELNWPGLRSIAGNKLCAGSVMSSFIDSRQVSRLPRRQRYHIPSYTL